MTYNNHISMDIIISIRNDVVALDGAINNLLGANASKELNSKPIIIILDESGRKIIFKNNNIINIQNVTYEEVKIALHKIFVCFPDAAEFQEKLSQIFLNKPQPRNGINKNNNIVLSFSKNLSKHNNYLTRRKL